MAHSDLPSPAFAQLLARALTDKNLLDRYQNNPEGVLNEVGIVGDDAAKIMQMGPKKLHEAFGALKAALNAVPLHTSNHGSEHSTRSS